MCLKQPRATISRRELILAAPLAAIGVIPITCRPAASTDLKPHNPPQILQMIINNQIKNGEYIIYIRSTRPIKVSGKIYVPQGLHIFFECDLIGDSNAKIIAQGDANLSFIKSKLHNVPIELMSGKVKISGFIYSGYEHLSAISINGPGPYYNLVVENFSITNANYGILRQGVSSTLNGAVIRGGVLNRLKGDGIEWNVCPNDSNVLIEDISISEIDGPADKPFWGIGIGFAGGHYSSDWNKSTSIKNFTIRRIKGNNLRQLIHVESGNGFLIEDIISDGLSSSFSEGNGLEFCSIACYGCSDFEIRNANLDSTIILRFGILRGNYIAPCTNFSLKKININGGDLKIDVGGAQSYLKMDSIIIASGSVYIRGQASTMSISDVKIVGKSKFIPAFIHDKRFLNGSLSRFNPPSPQISTKNLSIKSGP